MEQKTVLQKLKADRQENDTDATYIRKLEETIVNLWASNQGYIHCIEKLNPELLPAFKSQYKNPKSFFYNGSE